MINNEQPKIFSTIFDKANAVTLLGGIFSICGIFFAIKQNYYFSGALLGGALLADMCDGWVARQQVNRAKNLSNIGMFLDSLCDLLHGGILPMVLFCSLMNWTLWSLFISILFTSSSLIRLAYFSAFGPENDGAWRGLPVIFNSLTTCFLMIFSEFNFTKIILPIVLISIAFFNIQDIRIPKIKGKALGYFNFICLILIILNLIKGLKS